MPRIARDRARAFLFYPADYLNDPAVLRMGVLGRGAYGGALLPALWDQPEPGVVEDDDSLLALLAKCTPSEWRQVRDKVSLAFDTTSRPGFWIQRRMVAERIAQDRWFRAKSRLGKAAANMRWRKDMDATGNADAMPNDAGSGRGRGSSKTLGVVHEPNGSAVMEAGGTLTSAPKIPPASFPPALLESLKTKHPRVDCDLVAAKLLGAVPLPKNLPRALANWVSAADKNSWDLRIKTAAEVDAEMMAILETRIKH